MNLIVYYLLSSNLRDFAKKRRYRSFYQGRLCFDSDEENKYGEKVTF